MPRARCSLGTSLWLKCCSVVFTCVYRVYLCIVSWIVENTLSRIHHNTCIIILVLCSLVYTVFIGIHIVLLVGRVLYQSTCENSWLRACECMINVIFIVVKGGEKAVIMHLLVQ